MERRAGRLIDGCQRHQPLAIIAHYHQDEAPGVHAQDQEAPVLKLTIVSEWMKLGKWRLERMRVLPIRRALPRLRLMPFCQLASGLALPPFAKDLLWL